MTIMRPTPAFATVSLLWCIVTISASGQNNCRNKVEPFIRSMKSVLASFAPDPGSDQERDQFLDSIRTNDPGLFDRAQKIVLENNRKQEEDASWNVCVSQEFANIKPSVLDGDIALWFSHLSKRFLNFDLTSPEFERGFGIHADINQGVADLGRSSEGYSFACRLLLAYTFAKGPSGGKVRLLGGISTYYYNNKFSFFANPRLEYRLMDIGSDLTTFGNVKLIADGNLGDTWIAGGGVALELHMLGVQALYQRQGKGANSHVLLGLFYRFLK